MLLDGHKQSQFFPLNFCKKKKQKWSEIKFKVHLIWIGEMNSSTYHDSH